MDKYFPIVGVDLKNTQADLYGLKQISSRVLVDYCITFKLNFVVLIQETGTDLILGVG